MKAHDKRGNKGGESEQPASSHPNRWQRAGLVHPRGQFAFSIFFPKEQIQQNTEPNNRPAPSLAESVDSTPVLPTPVSLAHAGRCVTGSSGSLDQGVRGTQRSAHSRVLMGVQPHLGHSEVGDPLLWRGKDVGWMGEGKCPGTGHLLHPAFTLPSLLQAYPRPASPLPR